MLFLSGLLLDPSPLRLITSSKSQFPAFVVHLDDPFGRKEKAVLYLVGYMIIFLLGPGKYSIDKK